MNTPRVWHVGVVIPAQNEALLIDRCIASVLQSCAASERCAEAWIVIVADRCTDSTAVLARHRLEGRGEVIECDVRSPGTARRLGVAIVLRHFEGRHPQRVWLANTDADSHVPLSWIDTHLEHAEGDADAVAGIVQLDPEGLRDDIRDLYDRTYQIAPDGTHQHVHGANFGFVRMPILMWEGGVI